MEFDEAEWRFVCSCVWRGNVLRFLYEFDDQKTINRTIKGDTALYSLTKIHISVQVIDTNMKIKNKKRYGQFIYLFCFVHTIIQENTYCIARKNSQFVIQGVYGVPISSEPPMMMKTYYSPISPDEIELQKRGGKGMDRHLFASAAAATLAMGTAAMGVSTYSLRLHDWNKYKAGGGKEEKKKPGSIDTKAANKHDKSDKPKSPKSPKYYNSHVIVNNYYGSEAKPPPLPPPPKEEPNKKQKRSLEWQEGEGEVHIRKRSKFKGINRVFSGGSLTTICFTTTTKTINNLIKPSSLSPTIISDASSVSSRVGKTTKTASKTFGEMIGKSSPLREAGGKSHIPTSSSEAIGKLHPKKPSSRVPTSNHSSPSRRPTQGTLPSHTPPQPDPHPPTLENLSRKNVDQINPVTGKGYSPDTHFLGHDMSKHDKWAKFAGRVEDYGKVSAAVGAFTAGSLALHTTIQQHIHDAKKAKEEGKEEEKKKG